MLKMSLELVMALLELLVVLLLLGFVVGFPLEVTVRVGGEKLKPALELLFVGIFAFRVLMVGFVEVNSLGLWSARGEPEGER